MEQFLGLSRDASREKSEAGTSPFARNIVFDKQLGSITQENGFVPQEHIRGLTIGVHSTNTHIIYITYLTEDSSVLFSYVDTNTKIVTEVLQTKHFKYSVERPIEIIAWYNYNQELIIMFSDGVFEKSSAPRLINLMDLGVTLDINKEFLSEREAESTLLFSLISVPRFSILYGNKANHDCDLLFFTIAYILPDGITRTKFVSSLAEAFPLYGFKSEFKKEITFKIEDLDTYFNQFVIGIIAFRDNALFAYTTDPIYFDTTTYNYTFDGISNLTATTVEAITIETSIFERVKTLTIGNDNIILGGLITKPFSNYQKYANNLKLNLYFDYRLDNRHQAPLLCPDEVYYFTIALAFNNGTFSDELHIPNRDPEASELAKINKVFYGLTALTDTNVSSFQVINTGGWDNNSVGLPNFNNLSETKLKWGYWQNEELYPNDLQYNGTVDYDGTTVLANGRDLRNTNVKLHRVPGLDTLADKIPMRLGMDIKNESLPITRDMHTRMPAFSLNVDNFIDAFSNVIDKDKIIGYRLSFVKKDGSSKLVEDINFIKPLVTNTELNVLTEDDVKVDYTMNRFADHFGSTKIQKYYQFGFSKVKSINLSLYKGNTSARIIKANYGVLNSILSVNESSLAEENLYDKAYRNLENDSDTKGTVGQYSAAVIPTPATAEFLNFRMPFINQKYAVISSIEQVPGNVKELNNLFSHEQIKLKAKNDYTTYPAGYTPVPLFGWNPLNYQPSSLNDSSTTVSLDFYNPNTNSYVSKTLDPSTIKRINISSTLLNVKKNVHQGLNPKSFVTIGITNINNPALLFKDFGDTFSNNIFNEIVENFEYLDFGGTAPVDGVVYTQEIYSGLLSTNNNTLINFIKDKKLEKIYITDDKYNGEGTSNMVDLLLSFNYIKQEETKESTKQLNALIGAVAFNYNKKYISKYPYRIVKSLSIQSETLDTYNVRTFLANAYYDLSSIRGEIIYLVGFDKGVYCQQRYSLSIFQLKEKLSNNADNEAYLAEADLFAYKPQTIVDEDNKGYIGSVHQFGKKLTKDGLLLVDAERGKVYLIGGATPTDLSKIKMSNFFRSLLDDSINNIVPTLFNNTAASDNPYNGNGIVFGVDDRTNRILITINNYKALNVLPNGVIFRNGIPYNDTKILDIKNSLYTTNKSKTLSYNFDWKRWVAEHDYYPQFYANTNRRNYAGINTIKVFAGNVIEEKSLVYITNEENAKTGKYFYAFDNTIHESYIDLLFNSRYDLSKWYKSVLWRTTVKDNNGNSFESKTINAIILYTDYQCSGRTELNTKQFNLIRNSEGLWAFNDFRDLVKSSSDLPITNDGSYEVDKIYLNRNWFDKSDFISNFIIVRLIMNNVEDTQTHIHNVNTEARISDRI